MVTDHPKLPQQRPPVSTEDAGIKINTDCVYFLASPLTCKKGSECEYRHSDYARVNPRDCWYWMNGNCLNPECSFRHPPLDGLLGTQAEFSVGSSLAPSLPAVSANMHPPSNASKQTVPCIFFQKGMCLKADKCTFLHGPNPANTKASQVPADSSTAEPLSFKRSFASIIREENISQADTTKPVEVPNTKPVQNLETIPFKKEVFLPKDVLLSTSSSIINGNSINRPNHAYWSHFSDDHSLENNNDASESFRESSPGFDVLVDELRDPDFYHEEDQIDLARLPDYGSIMEINRGERFHDLHGFNPYNPMQEPYNHMLHMSSSSEGKFSGMSRVAKRGYCKVQIDTTDLRHQLSKQRRGFSGSRSVVSLDHDSPSFTEERCFIRNRLQGRIAFPCKPFPGDKNNFHLEKGPERRRSCVSSSPGKLQSLSWARRLSDRNSLGLHVNSGMFGETGSDFAGPKSLAELKGRKDAEKSRCGEGELLFEGPKPLNMILKQKMETRGGGGASYDDNEGGNENECNGLGVEDGLVQVKMEDRAGEEFDPDTGDHDEEYMEDEEEKDGEDDDFAKKIKSVMLSHG